MRRRRNCDTSRMCTPPKFGSCKWAPGAEPKSEEFFGVHIFVPERTKGCEQLTPHRLCFTQTVHLMGPGVDGTRRTTCTCAPCSRARDGARPSHTCSCAQFAPRHPAEARAGAMGAHATQNESPSSPHRHAARCASREQCHDGAPWSRGSCGVVTICDDRTDALGSGARLKRQRSNPGQGIPAWCGAGRLDRGHRAIDGLERVAEDAHVVALRVRT